ncbi:hypothetical protein TW95_gp0495 [Pandoravirus inopinatum]|uniref:Uncharacterized protein n=1 Tax=Pandoravirus inopinatum TaxID=1605721 RepID=A0A0B5J191_9VIRU|nr:hypothetical protein TW95_gp0495 [Pandoravirus inopinatum]AJF97229.1 hypothetical protein [Pandoravirus inopinatum]
MRASLFFALCACKVARPSLTQSNLLNRTVFLYNQWLSEKNIWANATIRRRARRVHFLFLFSLFSFLKGFFFSPLAVTQVMITANGTCRKKRSHNAPNAETGRPTVLCRRAPIFKKTKKQQQAVQKQQRQNKKPTIATNT